MTEKVKNSRTLNAKQAFQLASWLNDKRDWIVANKLGCPTLASEATKALGFPIGGCSIRTQLNAIGLRYSTGNGQGMPTQHLWEHLHKMEAEIQELKTKVERLIT